MATTIPASDRKIHIGAPLLEALGKAIGLDRRLSRMTLDIAATERPKVAVEFFLTSDDIRHLTAAIKSGEIPVESIRHIVQSGAMTINEVNEDRRYGPTDLFDSSPC